jgi:hypothetical protein
LFTAANSQAERTLAGQPDRFVSVLNDGAVNVFENKTVLPRAFLVPAANARPAGSVDAAFAALADPAFAPAHEVVVGPGPAVAPTNESPTAVELPAVSDLRAGDIEVTMTAETPVRAVLVLSQASYPGWKVYVDGEPNTMLRVDGMFQGVELTPGRHTVRFAFESGTVRLGAVLSLLSLIIVLGLTLVPVARRRRSR